VIDPDILRVVAITDNIRDGQAGLTARALAAISGGATCVQLRLKDVQPRDLIEIAREMVRVLPVPLIVNDRADVAIAAGASGVHLGADDVPAVTIRTIVPQQFIIGVSVGSDDEIAGASGADYVGIGPLFATVSKDDAGNPIGTAEFARLAARIGLPAVAIGGISAANARLAMDAGACGIASIAAIFGISDPAAGATALRSATETSHPARASH